MRQAALYGFVGKRFPVLFDQAGGHDVGTLGLQSYWPPRSPGAVAYIVATVCATKDAIVNSGVTGCAAPGGNLAVPGITEPRNAAAVPLRVPRDG